MSVQRSGVASVQDAWEDAKQSKSTPQEALHLTDHKARAAARPPSTAAVLSNDGLIRRLFQPLVPPYPWHIRQA